MDGIAYLTLFVSLGQTIDSAFTSNSLIFMSVNFRDTSQSITSRFTSLIIKVLIRNYLVRKVE